MNTVIKLLCAVAQKIAIYWYISSYSYQNEFVRKGKLL